MSMTEHLTRYYALAAELGLSFREADAVRRDAQRLHRWSEHECNGVIERVESEGRIDHKGRPMAVGKVYNVSNINGSGSMRYRRIADCETPALARIEAAAKKIGGTVEYQGDPRGWPITIRVGDVELRPPVRG